jgi:hypothetical protein
MAVRMLARKDVLHERLPRNRGAVIIIPLDRRRTGGKPMTIHFLNGFTCKTNFPYHWECGTIELLIETDDGLVLVDTGLGTGDYVHHSGILKLFRAIMIVPLDPAEAAIRQVIREQVLDVSTPAGVQALVRAMDVSPTAVRRHLQNLRFIDAANTNGLVAWELDNNINKNVASGRYIYYISGLKDSRTGSVSVVR